MLGIEILCDVTLFRLASAYRMLSSSSPTISLSVLTENSTALFFVRSFQLVTDIIVHFYVIHYRFIRIYTILVPRNAYKYIKIGCTWLRSSLRHCAISRKVAGSIPDDVVGIFH